MSPESGVAPAQRGLPGLPRNVVALGFVSLFTDVSTEMIVPVLPLFVVGVLGASMASVGVIEGVAEMVRRGIGPPIFRSANLPGGDEFNAKLLKKYKPRVKDL